MKFDVFYQLPCTSTERESQLYRELIDEAVEAERLGFHGGWLAEAHFLPRFSLMPAPTMFLAAIRGQSGSAASSRATGGGIGDARLAVGRTARVWCRAWRLRQQLSRL